MSVFNGKSKVTLPVWTTGTEESGDYGHWNWRAACCWQKTKELFGDSVVPLGGEPGQSLCTFQEHCYLCCLFIHPNGCILDNKYKDMLLKKWMNKKRSELFVHSITWTEVLQVVLVLKNLSDNAKGKGIRDAGFISGLRRSPAGGNWNPL